MTDHEKKFYRSTLNKSMNLCGVLPSTEELHAKEGKDKDEEKEKEYEGDDGLHGVHQRDDQVPQRRPVP